MSVQEAPLLLCRICSAWRTIALSTPRLWAFLHLPINFIASKEPLRLPAVARWLELSRACPISLSINDHGDNWDQNHWTSSCGVALIESLAPFSARWRQVELNTISPEAANELVEMRTPQLESLTFTGQVSFLSTLNLVKSRSLRSVTLYPVRSGQADDSILDIPFVWEQLTHLTVQYNLHGNRKLSVRTILTLLERCSQLVFFSFSLNETDETDEEADWGSGLIWLPHLRSFLVPVGHSTPSALSRLIDRLSMPQLRQFHVPTTMDSSGPDLVALGARSPLIENLTLYLSTLSPQSLPETLRAFPALIKLSVRSNSAWIFSEHPLPNTPSIAQVLDVLVSTLETPFCPALQELTLQTSDVLEKPTLDAFIQGRMKLAGLRRLEICSSDSSVVELMSEMEIQSCASHGLDISLFWNDLFKNWPARQATPWTGLLQE